MHPFLARFSDPVGSAHTPPWVDFITIMSVFKLSVHTGFQGPRYLNQRRQAIILRSGGVVHSGRPDETAPASGAKLGPFAVVMPMGLEYRHGELM
jgi:hypothetical protein